MKHNSHRYNFQTKPIFCEICWAIFCPHTISWTVMTGFHPLKFTNTGKCDHTFEDFEKIPNIDIRLKHKWPNVAFMRLVKVL